METKYKNIHQDIIDKCLLNDQKAQMQLYNLYYKSMFNTSLRILNNFEEAEDSMQEAFLTAFTKLNTYKGEVSFGVWLRKIIVNRAIDVLKRKKIIFESIDEKQLNIPNQNIDDEWKSVQARLENVKSAIMKLKDQYRIILSLYFLEGYDHEEISEILGIEVSTSRSQLTRAKEKLITFISTQKRN